MLGFCLFNKKIPSLCLKKTKYSLVIRGPQMNTCHLNDHKDNLVKQGLLHLFSCKFFCIGAPSLKFYLRGAVVLQFLSCYLTKMHRAATQECIRLEIPLVYGGVLWFARGLSGLWWSI